MKLSFSNRIQFINYAIKKHKGLLGIWFLFILFGSFFIVLGSKVKVLSLAFIIFGSLFIILSSAFMLFTLPSSFMYYYEQALTKKFGTYTTAIITNKRVDDYSHTTSTFNGSRPKKITTILYIVEFQFSYNKLLYKSECNFEHETTFNAITKATKLPIKFLKTNPEKVTLRRRKLANEIGIPEKRCQ